MNQLFQFLIRQRIILLFILLELINVWSIFKYDDFQHVIYLNTTNRWAASFLATSREIKTYHHLGEVNAELALVAALAALTPADVTLVAIVLANVCALDAEVAAELADTTAELADTAADPWLVNELAALVAEDDAETEALDADAEALLAESAADTVCVSM